MTPSKEQEMNLTAADYLALAATAAERPRQYRAGIESRMRRVWARLSSVERAKVYRESFPVGARVRITVDGSRLDGRQATVVRVADADVLMYGNDPMIRLQPDEDGGPEAEVFVTGAQIEALS
jgi:hypothetical protein